MAGRSTPTRLSRRRLLVASSATLAAAAPVVLAACGSEDEDEETSPARAAELLNQILAAQLAVLAAAKRALGPASAGDAAAINLLRVNREKSSRALAAAVAELEGSPTTEPAEQSAPAESPVEGLARQLETSIAAALVAIGELTPERRLPVHRAIVEDAAALAALRDALGEEVAPDAFVFGPPVAKEGAS